MSRARSVCLLLSLAIAAGCDGPDPTTAPSPASRPRTLTAPLAVLVMNTNDAGPGSLRQALADAQGGETIQFDAALAGQTIALTTGQLEVLTPVTIEGPTGGITISGNGTSRVMHTSASGIVLRNLTITGGVADASGAGIMNTGTLTIDHSTVSGNEASGPTTAAHNGGGVYNDFLRTVTIVNSTISGNTARVGGGIYSDGTVTLINSTVAFNAATTGAGGVLTNGLLLRNALLSNNTAVVGANCAVNSTSVVYEGTNLSSDASCGTDAAMLVGNPMLAPLASNGGPTQTHALLAGSEAVNAATACNVTSDQRYTARPQPVGGACDIGAFEFTDFLQPALTIDASVTVNPKTGIAVVSGTIACSRQVAAELEITLVQNQKVGRVSTTLNAADLIAVDCVGTKYWSVALAPASGGYQTGAATASARTTTLDAWSLPVAATRPVKLYWGRK